MWFALMFMVFQQLDQPLDGDWEAMARPWMTQDEARLYDQLSESEQLRFRGAFTARRSEDPHAWPKSGLVLPAFRLERTHGDIRDYIQYVLGEPKSIKPNITQPKVPQAWVFEQGTFVFESLDATTVQLARESRGLWDRVKVSQIRHPELRYDFQVGNIGRTRLPEDVAFEAVSVSNAWQIPALGGAKLRLHVPIPDSLRDYLRSQKQAAVQQMELLVRLRRADEVDSPLVGERVRHASQRLNLMTEGFMTFEVFLPEGFYQAEIQVYSGQLKRGLSSNLDVFVRGESVPQISDPLISQDWTHAGIEQFSQALKVIGDTVFRTAPVYSESVPGRVLVHSSYDDTRVSLISKDGSNALEKMARVDDWHIFNLPPQKSAFRLVSLGFPKQGTTVAIGSWGQQAFTEDARPPAFEQQGERNYLSLESLNFRADSLTFLYLNNQPYLASQDGRFPWLGVDWGKTVQLRFEYARDGQWYRRDHLLKRRGVFEQIQVKPRYVVAGTRQINGFVAPAKVDVSVVGQPVKVVSRTPYKELPKVWGLVVNDPLLKSEAWSRSMDAIKSFFRDVLTAEDHVYLVHAAERPELVVAPTQNKAVFLAALESLAPKTRNENYFRVRFLLDALSQMEIHNRGPHQVLMLTNRLTSELSQMEELIPILRGTGLQLYNFEFPFAEQTDSQQRVSEGDSDALKRMAELEEQRRRHRAGLTDHFLNDDDGSVPVGRIKFGKKAASKRQQEDRLREEAFVKAFNTQMSTLTAGMYGTASVGDPSRPLNAFLGELKAWQESMVHLSLSIPFVEEDMLRVTAPEGYQVYWTLVGWQVGK